MRIWLPYDTLVESTRCLTTPILKRVRQDCKDILLAIEAGQSNPRFHTPAVQMWIPYPGALCVYGIYACGAYRDRGYKSMEMYRSFERHRKQHVPHRRNFKEPWWLHDATLIGHHRANLVFLDPDHFGRLFPEVTPSLVAWWPPAKKPQPVIPDDVEEEVFD